MVSVSLASLMNPIFLRAVVFATSLGSIFPALADPFFFPMDIGTLGGHESRACAVNASNQVVGTAQTENGDWHAFVWKDGTMTDLGTLGGANSEARGINDRGMIVGRSDTADGKSVAFVYVLGVMAPLGTLPGHTTSLATGINNDGWIVGESSNGTGDKEAFLYRNGRMVGLGTLPGGATSTAVKINGAGQIIGNSSTATVSTRGFLWQNEVMLDLGALESGAETAACDLNEAGQVLGWSSASNGSTRAFLYKAGVMKPAGSFDRSPSISPALGLFETGDAYLAGTGDYWVNYFIGSKERTLFDYMLDHWSQWPGSYIQEINDINRRGVIVGAGRVNTSEYESYRRAYVFFPLTAPKLVVNGPRKRKTTKNRITFRGTLSGFNAELLVDSETNGAHRSVGKIGALSLKGPVGWRVTIPLKKGRNRIGFVARNYYKHSAYVHVVRKDKTQRKSGRTVAKSTVAAR